MDHDKKKENTSIKKIPKSKPTKKGNSKNTFKLTKEIKADLDSIFHF